MSRRMVVPAGWIVAGIVLVGCNMSGSQKDDDASAKNSGGSMSRTDKSSHSLYDRLGGEPTINTLVDDLVARAADDPKVNFTRKGHPNEWQPNKANIDKLKKSLVQFIVQNTGGPPKYAGRDMVSAHTGMEITEGEFNAFVADLKASLDKFHVGEREQNELIAIIGSTKGSIVGK